MILKGLNQGGPDETEGAFGKAERSSGSAGAGLSAVVDFGTDPCMHRNKDVFLGEDGCTSRKDNAPHVLFILNNLVLSILASVSSSPTQALEYFQDNKNRAIRHFT